jgi:hypothetical protein
MNKFDYEMFRDKIIREKLTIEVCIFGWNEEIIGQQR